MNISINKVLDTILFFSSSKLVHLKNMFFKMPLITNDDLIKINSSVSNNFDKLNALKTLCVELFSDFVTTPKQKCFLFLHKQIAHKYKNNYPSIIFHFYVDSLSRISYYFWLKINVSANKEKQAQAQQMQLPQQSTKKAITYTFFY